MRSGLMRRRQAIGLVIAAFVELVAFVVVKIVRLPSAASLSGGENRRLCRSVSVDRCLSIGVCRSVSVDRCLSTGAYPKPRCRAGCGSEPPRSQILNKAISCARCRTSLTKLFASFTLQTVVASPTRLMFGTEARDGET